MNQKRKMNSYKLLQIEIVKLLLPSSIIISRVIEPKLELIDISGGFPLTAVGIGLGLFTIWFLVQKIFVLVSYR